MQWMHTHVDIYIGVDLGEEVCYMCVRANLCVCVCVCVRVRARLSVYVRVCG